MEQKSDKTPAILIVDDVEVNARLLKKMVEKIGYIGITAAGVNEAVKVMEKTMPQLILLDIVMPHINGYQFCELLKNNQLTRDIPVIFVSAANELNDKMKAFNLGAVDFISKPFDYGEVVMRVNTHLKMYRMQRELEDSKRRLSIIVGEQAKKFEEEQKRLLKALAKLSEGEDDTGMTEHLENVSYNSRLLAQALNFTDKYENEISQSFIEAVELAGTVHDIGKIKVPREVLEKNGKLTKSEWEMVKHHTDGGYEIIKAAYPDIDNNRFIKLAAEVVRGHHEDWDGSGYPDGLKGEDIPLSARIVKIVDVYDSILSERCYRAAYTKQQAEEYMQSGRGTRFDPYILDIFFKIEKQLKKPQ